MVFVVGCPRSGTTWMWGLLTSHPGIVSLDWEDFGGHPSFKGNKRITSETGAFINFDDKHILRCIGQKAKKNAGKILVEKTPSHTLHLDRITNLIPHALFLFMVRDPRSNISSMLHSTFYTFATSLDNALETYLKYNDVIRHYKYDKRFMSIRYEDLHRETAHTLGRVFQFIGLESDGIDDIIKENALKVKVDIPGVFRKGIINGYVEELSRDEIDYIQTKTSDMMGQLGYDKI